MLKGWRTLVAHPDGRIAVNTSGNPAMAKGGSGDVLTGIVAAMIAQFPLGSCEAVECGGLAAWRGRGRFYVRTHDEHTMLATDMLRIFTQAMLRARFEHDGFCGCRMSGDEPCQAFSGDLRVHTTDSCDETIALGRSWRKLLPPPKVVISARRSRRGQNDAGKGNCRGPWRSGAG